LITNVEVEIRAKKVLFNYLAFKFKISKTGTQKVAAHQGLSSREIGFENGGKKYMWTNAAKNRCIFMKTVQKMQNFKFLYARPAEFF
jgi:hypothetical protein